MPVQCQSCDYENRNVAAYCGGCGRSLPRWAACPACGFDNPVGQRYCNACGARLGVQVLPRLSAAPAGAPAAVATSEAPTVPVPPHIAPAPALPAVAAPYANRAGALAFAAVTLGFAVAVSARFYRLGDIPGAIHSVEGAFLRAAAVIRAGDWTGLWLEATGGQPAGLAYLLAGWSSVFGDSTVALRLPSAAIGVATVGAFYLFCRGFIGPRAATLGSLLLGLSMWHLHYSRAALPSVLLPLAALATTYLLYQALSERRDSSRQRRLLLLAGLAFGAGAYTHNAFFIFAAAVLALWAREFLAGEQSPNEVFSKCMTFFVPALLVATPYLATLTANSGQVLEQVRTVAVSRAPEYQERQGVPDQTRYLLWNTVKTAGAVYWRREAGDGSRRLLDPVTGLLAGLGLLVGLRRWRDRWHFFLLALIVAAVVTGALTREAGTYGRMTVAMPAIFAYAGLALDGLLQLMKGRLTQVAAYAVVAAMFLFVAAFNLSSYFSHPLGVNQVLWAMATYP